VGVAGVDEAIVCGGQSDSMLSRLDCKLSLPFLEGGVLAARAPADASCALERLELTSNNGAQERDTCSKPALTVAV